MTTPIPPVVGDVLIKGGKSYDVIARDAKIPANLWLREITATVTANSYLTMTPAEYATYTKKEPVFEVGHIYKNLSDPTLIVYTVALVDGVSVLVWWTDPTGLRWASWVPYSDRKNYEEIK